MRVHGGSGRAYRTWTAEEEEALRQGVAVYGVGSWEAVRNDPRFAILSDRTGVQLKDKFRNLVRFNHIDPASLAPKRRSETRESNEGSVRGRRAASRPRDGDDDAAESAEASGDGAQGSAPARSTQRRRIQSSHSLPSMYYSGDEDAGGDGGDAAEYRPAPARRSSKKKGRSGRRRMSPEDRRFGIYDHRRYSHARRRAAPRSVSPDEDAALPDAGGDHDGGSGMDGAPGGEGGDEQFVDAVVNCPCGATHDDGTLMVECEDCQAWAHVQCLKARGATDEDLDVYVCDMCFAERTQHGPSALSALRASSAALGSPRGDDASAGMRHGSSLFNDSLWLESAMQQLGRGDGGVGGGGAAAAAAAGGATGAAPRRGGGLSRKPRHPEPSPFSSPASMASSPLPGWPAGAATGAAAGVISRGGSLPALPRLGGGFARDGWLSAGASTELGGEPLSPFGLPLGLPAELDALLPAGGLLGYGAGGTAGGGPGPSVSASVSTCGVGGPEGAVHGLKLAASALTESSVRGGRHAAALLGGGADGSTNGGCLAAAALQRGVPSAPVDTADAGHRRAAAAATGAVEPYGSCFDAALSLLDGLPAGGEGSPISSVLSIETHSSDLASCSVFDAAAAAAAGGGGGGAAPRPGSGGGAYHSAYHSADAYSPGGSSHGPSSASCPQPPLAAGGFSMVPSSACLFSLPPQPVTGAPARGAAAPLNLPVSAVGDADAAMLELGDDLGEDDGDDSLACLTERWIDSLGGAGGLGPSVLECHRPEDAFFNFDDAVIRT